MATDKRTAYRPLGVSLRDFARSRIRAYVPAGDLISRSSLPSSWAAAANEPLAWDAPVQTAALTPSDAAEPADIEVLAHNAEMPVSHSGTIQRAPDPAANNEEAQLRAIMAAHNAKRAAAAAASDSPPPVQRSAAPEGDEIAEVAVAQAEAPETPAAETPVTAMPRRRRGQVVDITPPQPTGVFDERLWDGLAPKSTTEIGEAAPASSAAGEDSDFFERAAVDPASEAEPAAAPDANTSASPVQAVQRSPGAIQRSALSEDAPHAQPAPPPPPAVVELTPPVQIRDAASTAFASDAPAVQRTSAPHVETSFTDLELTDHSSAGMVSAPADAFEALLTQSEAPAPPMDAPPAAAAPSPEIGGAPAAIQSPALQHVGLAAAPDVPQAGPRIADDPFAVTTAAFADIQQQEALPQPDATQPSMPAVDAPDTALQRAENAPASLQRTAEKPAPATQSSEDARPQVAVHDTQPSKSAADTALQRAENAPASLQRTAEKPAPTTRPPEDVRSQVAAHDTQPSKSAADASDTALQHAENAPASLQRVAEKTISATRPLEDVRPQIVAHDMQPSKSAADAPDTALQRAENAPASLQRAAEKIAPITRLPEDVRPQIAAHDTQPSKPAADALDTALQRAENAPASLQRTADTVPAHARISPENAAEKTLSAAIDSPALADDPLTALIQRAEAPSQPAVTSVAAQRAPADSGVPRPSAPAHAPPVESVSPAAPAAGRPTLPDAPTLLEPAAPQGLSDVIQRAITATEEPLTTGQDANPSGVPAPDNALDPSAKPATRPEPVVLDSRLNPSPWSSYMNAPGQSSAPRRPASVSPSVQRRPAQLPPASPRLVAPQDALQRAAGTTEDGQPMQEIDLHQALMQEGMVAPDETVRTQPPDADRLPQVTVAPPSAPLSASAQRKPASGEAAGADDGQNSPASSSVPDPGSVEAAMLDLLNLPPDTSVYGLKSASQPAPKPANAPPALQRLPLDEALGMSGRAPATETQRAIGANEVQRAAGADEVAVEASADEDDSPREEPDVEDLARKVYRILKDKLRVERERSTR